MAGGWQDRAWYSRRIPRAPAKLIRNTRFYGGPATVPPHDELNDAGLYLESVSNYDGSQASDESNADVLLDNLYSGGGYGETYCVGSINTENFCEGQIVLSVNPTLIEQHGRNLRTTWCHEIGHMAGANHLLPQTYGINTGCVHSAVHGQPHEHYHEHHITDHLQWTGN